MSTLKFLASELLSLFIDDEFLAVAILVVAGLAAFVQWSGAGAPWLAGAVLLLGCLFVLVASAIRGGKK